MRMTLRKKSTSRPRKKAKKPIVKAKPRIPVRTPANGQPPPPPRGYREPKVEVLILDEGPRSFDDMTEEAWNLDAVLRRTLEHIDVHSISYEAVRLDFHFSKQGLERSTLPATIKRGKLFAFPTGTGVMFRMGEGDDSGRAVLTLTPWLP